MKDSEFSTCSSCSHLLSKEKVSTVCQIHYFKLCTACQRSDATCKSCISHRPESFRDYNQNSNLGERIRPRRQDSRKVNQQNQQSILQSTQKQVRLLNQKIDQYKQKQYQRQIQELKRQNIKIQDTFKRQLRELDNQLQQQRTLSKALTSKNEVQQHQFDAKKKQLQQQYQISLAIAKNTFQFRNNQMIQIFNQSQKSKLLQFQNHQYQLRNKSKQQNDRIKSQYENVISQLRRQIGTTIKQIQDLHQKSTSDLKEANTKYQELQTLHMKNIQNLQKNFQLIMENTVNAITDDFNRQKGETQRIFKDIIQDQRNSIIDLQNIIIDLQTKVKEYEQQLSGLKRQMVQIYQRKKEKNQLVAFQVNQQYKPFQSEYIYGFLENNNKNLIDHFKLIDCMYKDNNKTEWVKKTQLLIRQYKQLQHYAKFDGLYDIIQQKEQIIINYVREVVYSLEQVKLEIEEQTKLPISQLQSFLQRQICKIKLFRSLDNANINSIIQLQHVPKLINKIKIALNNFCQTISLQTLLNINQVVQSSTALNHHRRQQQTLYQHDTFLAQIKQIAKDIGGKVNQFPYFDEVQKFYQLKDFLRQNLPEHQQYCKSEYDRVNSIINTEISKFTLLQTSIKNGKIQKDLSNYLQIVKELVKFIYILICSKNHPRFALHLQKKQNETIQSKKVMIRDILSLYKQQLKEKLNNLVKNRAYLQLANSREAYEKFIVLDDLCSKEGQYSIESNFREVLHQFDNQLLMIKQQKIILIKGLITFSKIRTVEVEQELLQNSFDSDIKNGYVQRLMLIVDKRKQLLDSINEATLITEFIIHHFCSFYDEVYQLNSMQAFQQCAFLKNHLNQYTQKISYFKTFLIEKSEQYYCKAIEFSQLKELKRNIESIIKLQLFLEKYFKNEHQQFKESFLTNNRVQFLSISRQGRCINNFIQKLIDQSQENIKAVLNDSNQIFSEKHFRYYANITSGLSKEEKIVFSERLHQTVKTYIQQLQKNQWLLGNFNSPSQVNLMKKLSHLPEKINLLHRDLIHNHKEQMIARQQMNIRKQGIKLKQNSLQNVQKFILQSEKHQLSSSYFSKTYFDYLEKFANQAFDAEDSSIAIHKISQIYKLNLSTSTQSVRRIFKDKQCGIYFKTSQMVKIRQFKEWMKDTCASPVVTAAQPLKSLLQAYELHHFFLLNQNKSLLHDQQREIYKQTINSFKEFIENCYIQFCQSIKGMDLFSEEVNVVNFLTRMVKIQICLSFIKRNITMNPQSQDVNNIGLYNKIVQRQNQKFQEILKEVKSFNFFADRLATKPEQQLIEALNNIEQHIIRIKEVQQGFNDLGVLLKQNYLNGITFKNVEFKEFIRMIQIAWMKQYQRVKQEMSKIFTNPNWKISHKCKQLIMQREILIRNKAFQFAEICKEDYDIKKIVPEKLVKLQMRCQNYFFQLGKHHQLSMKNINKINQQKKRYVQEQTQIIKKKYKRLIDQSRQSHKEIEQGALRQTKIQSEVNLLQKQMKAQKEQLNNYKNNTLERFRSKQRTKNQYYAIKIFETLKIIQNIGLCFDENIKTLSESIFETLHRDIDNLDQPIKCFLKGRLEYHKNPSSNSQFSPVSKLINKQRPTSSSFYNFSVHLFTQQKDRKAIIDEVQLYMKCQKVVLIKLRNEDYKNALIQKYSQWDDQFNIKYIKGYTSLKELSEEQMCRIIVNNTYSQLFNKKQAEFFQLFFIEGPKSFVNLMEIHIRNQLLAQPIEEIIVRIDVDITEIFEYIKKRQDVEEAIKNHLYNFVISKHKGCWISTIQFIHSHLRLVLVERGHLHQSIQNTKYYIEQAIKNDLKIRSFESFEKIDKEAYSKIQQNGKLKILDKNSSSFKFFCPVEELNGVMIRIFNILDSQIKLQEKQCPVSDSIMAQKLNEYLNQEMNTNNCQQRSIKYIYVSSQSKIMLYGRELYLSGFAQKLQQYKKQLGTKRNSHRQIVTKKQGELLKRGDFLKNIQEKYEIIINIRQGFLCCKFVIKKNIPTFIKKNIQIIKTKSLDYAPYGSLIVFQGKGQIQKFCKSDCQSFFNVSSNQRSSYLLDGKKYLIIMRPLKELFNNLLEYTKIKDNIKHIVMIMPKKEKNSFVKSAIQLLLNYQQLDINFTILQPDEFIIPQEQIGILSYSKGRLSQLIEEKITKFYAIENENKFFYSHSGNLKILKATQQGQKKLILNNDDLNVTHTSHKYLIQKNALVHIQSSNQFKITNNNNIFRFTLFDKTYQIPLNQASKILKGIQQNATQVNISLGVYEIDLTQMTQTNLFSGFTRQLGKQEMKANEKVPYEGVQVFYNLGIEQIQYIYYQDSEKDNFNNARLEISRNLEGSLQQKTISFSEYTKIQVDDLEEIKISIEQDLETQFTYNIQKKTITLKNIDESVLRMMESGIILMLKYFNTRTKYPSEWQSPQLQDIKTFEVKIGSQEFNKVQKLFVTVAPIKKLLRIQNRIIYKKYYQEGLILEAINGGKQVKKMLLFHGTKLTDPKKIYQDKEQSFNINFSRYSNLLGCGIYFAEQPKYSHDYRHAIDPNTFCMFLCEVLVGQSEKCQIHDGNIRDTSFKDEARQIKYESMTDFLNGSNIYTVYKSRRAYPMYLIVY